MRKKCSLPDTVVGFILTYVQVYLVKKQAYTKYNLLGSTSLLFTAYITDPSHNYGWHVKSQNSLWTDSQIVTMLATFTDEI